MPIQLDELGDRRRKPSKFTVFERDHDGDDSHGLLGFLAIATRRRLKGDIPLPRQQRLEANKAVDVDLLVTAEPLAESPISFDFAARLIHASELQQRRYPPASRARLEIVAGQSLAQREELFRDREAFVNTVRIPGGPNLGLERVGEDRQVAESTTHGDGFVRQRRTPLHGVGEVDRDRQPREESGSVRGVDTRKPRKCLVEQLNRRTIQVRERLQRRSRAPKGRARERGVIFAR